MLHKFGPARKPAATPKKRVTPALKVWKMNGGITIRKISAKRFRTDTKTEKGGLITFTTPTLAKKFEETLDSYREPSFSNPYRAGQIFLGPKATLVNPVFMNNILPHTLTVLGHINVLECTFDASADRSSNIFIAATQPGSGATSVKCCIFRRTSRLEVATSRTHLFLELDRSTVSLAGHEVSETKFDDVSIHVPPDGSLLKAVVNADSLPMFFMHVGDDDGTLTAYRGVDGKVMLSRGCFIGTVEEFRKELSFKKPNAFWLKHYPPLLRVIEASFKHRADGKSW